MTCRCGIKVPVGTLIAKRPWHLTDDESIGSHEARSFGGLRYVGNALAKLRGPREVSIRAQHRRLPSVPRALPSNAL